MTKTSNRVLIIVGMHRSMTSLTTQWLHKCGLQVGDDMYGADMGNPKGHLEDNDFIDLHDYILKINNSHWRDSSGQNFKIDDYSKQKSRMLIRLKNELYNQWGWKDPRTCLFLDHWNDLLPEAKYLIIYRPFTEVVDSLLRREFKVKNRVEYLFELRKYTSKFLNYNKIKMDNLKFWMHYNSKILDFLQETEKKKFLVLKNDQLLKESDSIFEHITNEWGFELEYTPLKSVFDADMTQQAPQNFSDGIDKKLLQRALEIENQLAAYTELEESFSISSVR